MSTNELVPLTVAGIGLYVVLVRRNLGLGWRRWRWPALGSSLPCMWSCRRGPAWAGVDAPPALSVFDARNPGPLRILERVVTDPAQFVSAVAAPENLRYLEELVRPVGYLALFGAPCCYSALPELLMGLSADFSFDQTLFIARKRSHDRCALRHPRGDLWSVVSGRSGPKIELGFGSLVLQVCLLVVLVASLWSYWNAVFQPLTDAVPLAASRGATIADMVRRVPRESVVSAGSNVHPHLSQRLSIYVFPELADAEYVLIDVLGNPAPLDVAGQRFRFDQMVDGTGEWVAN